MVIPHEQCEFKGLIINIEEENEIFTFPQEWAFCPIYEVKRPPHGAKRPLVGVLPLCINCEYKLSNET